jgi:1,4-alpha-glucan branching enzyme
MQEEKIMIKEWVNEDELKVVQNSEHRDPHHMLGQHKIASGILVNVFLPFAKNVTVINLSSKKKYEMEKVTVDGFFTVKTTCKKEFEYSLEIENFEGITWEIRDPYSFEPVIDELDLYLFGEGTHYEIYKKLGSHPIEINGVSGTHFAVWAPNAKRVSVVGDFNGWDGRVHQMRALGNSGIFEIFVPGVNPGQLYKFEIKTYENAILKKTDPYGNYAELRPNTASIVYDIENFNWNDEAWINIRKNKANVKAPISIYELHMGSWKMGSEGNGFRNYRDIARDLVEYIKELGYTHVELMPVSEHPFDGSWGYQVTGYYAPTSRFGTPDDFMYFVNYLHENEIGIILDWVPAHFPKDAHGLAKFDGSALYEHADPKQGEHPHWGTLIFNYGRKEIKNFLIGNALFWLEHYHIDGLRVDAVASMLYLDYGKEEGEWVPNIYGGRENLDAVEFFKHLNSITYQRNPGIVMIAEESTSWGGVSRPVEGGGLGFGYKWNMGWMNDFLRYIEKEAVHRKYHHNDLTFSMVYAYTENFMLVLSHDEVVHGKGSMINKMPGDYWQKFANLRATYGFMFGHPGKKLLFMGQDIAQFDEWSESKSIQWNLLQFENHRQMKHYMACLNKLYKSEPALYELDDSDRGFEWINCVDAEASIVSFIRKTEDKKDTLIYVCNFTPVPRESHRIGYSEQAQFEEIFSSDRSEFGGSGFVNTDVVYTENMAWDGRENSMIVKVPPLGITVLKIKS